MDDYYTEELTIRSINYATRELFSLTKERLEEVTNQMKNGDNLYTNICVETNFNSFAYYFETKQDIVYLEELNKVIDSIDKASSFKYMIDFCPITYNIEFWDDGETKPVYVKMQEYFEEKFDKVADYAEYRSVHEMEGEPLTFLNHYQNIKGILYGFKDQPVYSQKVKKLPEGNWLMNRGFFIDIPACCNKGVVSKCINELTERYGEPGYFKNGDAFNVDGPSYMFEPDIVKDPSIDAEILLKLYPAIDEILGTDYSDIDPEDFDEEFVYRNYSDNKLSEAKLCLDFKNQDYYFILY